MFQTVSDHPSLASPPTTTPASANNLPTRDRPAQVKTPVDQVATTSEDKPTEDEGSDYEDAHEDSVWWTPDELRVS